jgi:hypothetical protein
MRYFFFGSTYDLQQCLPLFQFLDTVISFYKDVMEARWKRTLHTLI